MSELESFVADVVGRYPVEEIVLFGSRARDDARPDSDWDVIVCLSDESAKDALLADTTLQRHFTTFLDLFTLAPDGVWDYPAWTTIDGGRGWFPYNSAYRYDIQSAGTQVWPKRGAA